MNIKGIIEKVEHVKLSIYAHPDSQPNSEMADCVDTLSEIIQHLKAHLSDFPNALHAQISETQRLYQTILDIEYRGKASGIELYDCVVDEAAAVLDNFNASAEKPKMYQP
jgi:chromosome condensin MukBEF ATPase and DNA-binding subunit MukB